MFLEMIEMSQDESPRTGLAIELDSSDDLYGYQIDGSGPLSIRAEGELHLSSVSAKTPGSLQRPFLLHSNTSYGACTGHFLPTLPCCYRVRPGLNSWGEGHS